MRQQAGQTSDSRASRILKPGADGAIVDGDFSSTGIMVRTGSGTYTTRTLTAAGNGLSVVLADGVSGNPIIVLANKVVTRSHILYVESPADTDVFPMAYVPDAVTFTLVRAQTDAGTAAFNIERRATTSPGSSGTDIMSSDLTATTSGPTSSAFNSLGQVAADQWLVYVATTSGVSGASKLWVTFEYTID